MPRLLHALLIAALLVSMSGVLTVAMADVAAECTDGGTDDDCPDGAPWGCSSICTSCPCTSVTVPAPGLVLAIVLPAEAAVASIAPEQSHWPAPNLAGIFRPPRAA
ncbi:MAG: hypothetical protein AB7R00_17290 [Kofleriaceae bacterium]